MFPPTMKVTHLPHLDVLGAPIGDNLHCAGFFANKRAMTKDGPRSSIKESARRTADLGPII